MKRRIILTLISLSLLIGFTLWTVGRGAQAKLSLGAPAVTMATITVTNTDDDGAGSLRQAIADAMSGDTINIDVTGIITLTSGELVIGKDLTIQGPGASLLAISGNNTSGVFNISTGFTVTLSAMTIRDSGNVVQGGGVMNRGALTINDCIICNNTATQGGGVQNDGTMTVNNSAIHDNSATNFGGAGILSFGVLTINNSLVANNDTAPGVQGGGIYAMSGLARVINSTISGNDAQYGGGIRVAGGVSTIVTNCTITGNKMTGGDGGGIYFDGVSPSVTLKNTIVAGNFGPDGISPNDIYSISLDASSSYNLIGVGGAGGLLDGVNNNQVGVVDPMLAPLADNGGSTMTHALLCDSPAIDSGSNTLALDANNNALTTDQRGAGFDRIRDGDGDSAATVDIGAFEAQAPLVCNQYSFSGFFQPVDNLPTVNVVNAGRAIPIKFSLGGNKGLNILAAGYPSSAVIACDFSGGTSDIEETVTAGGGSLSYDAATGVYTYVWKTNSAWKNTCRKLIVKLNDGSERIANFKFK